MVSGVYPVVCAEYVTVPPEKIQPITTSLALPVAAEVPVVGEVPDPPVPAFVTSNGVAFAPDHSWQETRDAVDPENVTVTRPAIAVVREYQSSSS